MKQILLGLLMAAVPFAHAGRIVGNGGDVVVCRGANNSILSIELLDFYEARVERGQAIQLDPNKTVEENVAIYMDRLGSYDLYQKQRFQAYYQEFNNEARFMAGVELVDIPDSDHISFPAGCKVEQIAIQKNPKYPGERRYSINEDLWNQMTTADRAGLIMHEIIYRDTVEMVDQLEEDVNSIPTRFLNSTIAANGLTALLTPEYFSVLRELKYTYASWKDFVVELGYTEFFDNGFMNVTYAYFKQDQQVTLNDDVTVTVGAEDTAYFYFTKQVKDQLIAFRMNAKEQTIEIGDHVIHINSDESPRVEFSFDESGLLSQISEVNYELPQQTFNLPQIFKCLNFTFVDELRESFSCKNLVVKSDPLQVMLDQAQVATFGPNRKLATAEFNEYGWQIYSHYIVSYRDTGYPLNMKCLDNSPNSYCMASVKYNDKLGGGHVQFQFDDTVEFDSQGNYLSGGHLFED